MSLNPNAVDIAVARVLEDDPDRNVRAGSATRIFVIDPWAMMNQPIVTDALSLRDRLSVARMGLMSETEADELAANFAVTRRPGAPARGVVRAYFAEPATVTIPQTARFQSGGGIAFAPSAQVEISAAAMRLNAEGSVFFVDVAVEAEAPGEAGNVPPGSVTTILDGPAGVSYVSNREQFGGGIPRETNAQLAQRIPQAIALRALVSKPGIGTIIQDRFPEVSALVAVGKGDPEMERDVVSGTNLMVGGEEVGDADPFHVGGHVDVYIRTLGYLSRTTTMVFAAGDVRPILVIGRAAENENEVSVPAELPFMGLSEIQVGDPAIGICDGTDFLEEGVDFDLVPENGDQAFSMRGIWRIHLLASGPRFAEITDDPGRSLAVSCFTNVDVAPVQEFVESDAVRNLCADTLVKAMTPAFVDVDVTFKPKPAGELQEGEEEATTTAVIASIRAFLLDIESSDGFNIDDLYRKLLALPIERLNTPIIVRTSMTTNHGAREEAPPADEYLVMLRANAPLMQPVVRISLPDSQIKDRGIGLGDTLFMTWASGTAEREIIGVERANPDDDDLSVLVLVEAAPAVAVAVALEVRRSTVGNVAPVPRTARLMPRRIRALALPV